MTKESQEWTRDRVKRFAILGTVLITTGFPMAFTGLIFPRVGLLAILISILFVLFGIAFLMSFLIGLFMIPKIKPGACESCGYDLTGNQSGICPECGVGINV